MIFSLLFCHVCPETVQFLYRGADKSLARPGRKQATATEDFDFHIQFIIIIGGILLLFIHITRLCIEPFSASHTFAMFVQLTTQRCVCVCVDDVK
jgi:hypothetical protein